MSRPICRAALAALALVACGRPPGEGGRDPASRSDAATLGDAHGAHGQYRDRPQPEARVAACLTCHTPHGGSMYSLDQTLALRGGTSTAGASLTRAPAGATCVVACHFPFVRDPALRRAVAWRGGPLGCTECHREVQRVPRAASSHAPIFGDARAASPDPTTCATCHAEATQRAAHLSGDPNLAAADAISAACVACHAGAGQVLRSASEERTPPLLVGWTDPAGDFHGARAGAGFGGALAAPYARGAAPLPCTACHAGHASENAFLVAARVNGREIPPGAIDRAGVGAEALCGACHEGERHAGCLACHAGDPRPAGSACFWCHGHEGIRRFPAPAVAGRHAEPAGARDCSHCHGAWLPAAVDRAPPVILSLEVSDVGRTGATVRWRTSEPVTAELAYGAEHAGIVVRSPSRSTEHAVALAGLAPATAYRLRVLATDDFRNRAVSPLGGFTTLGLLTPAAPAPVPIADLLLPWNEAGAGTATATLSWGPVQAPDGDAVEYRVLAATDAAFTAGVVDSGWRRATAFELQVSGDAFAPPTAYRWKVQARDAVHGDASPWSTVDAFLVSMVNPYDG